MKLTLVSTGVLILCTLIVDVSNAYTCSGTTEPSAQTITGVGNSIASCTMQGTVTVTTGAALTVTGSRFEGTSQLVIDAGATVLVTGSSFADTTNVGNPSIEIADFDASSQIEILGNTFEDEGLITLPSPMTLSGTSTLKIMNNDLTLASRGGADTLIEFISCTGRVTLDAGSELIVTGNTITSVDFAIFGGILILHIYDLEPISTTGGRIVVSDNTGFPFLVKIDKGTFITAGAGALNIDRNTQVSVNALKAEGNAIEIFKASGAPFPPMFVVTVDHNSFDITIPAFDFALVGGQALWVFNMEVGKGLQGRVYIRHNTIDFTHADTNTFQTPFYLKLGNSIADGMTGLLDISDNIATLRTPTNFISVVNIYGTDNQVFVQRRVQGYYGGTL